MAKENKITLFNNGVQTRLHNRKITLIQKEDDFILEFLFADEQANEPACEHSCLKGKVRMTKIKLSNEALEAMLFSYMEFKKNKKYKKQ
jgi:hypothetical protein